MTTITKTIPFAKPWITDDDRNAVMNVLRGDILTHGPQNHAFEEEFAAFMGGEAYCVAVGSCMAALHLTYWQLGLGPGDEVIVPAQTHVATAHAVEVVGARAVFVDCESRTGNIDPARIEAKISPRTKAISLVHFLGIPCDMDEILSLAERHNLKLVEDCALAVGAHYNGRHVGLLGDAGCFSFYPVKHMTTGDGGMFVSRHRDLAEKVAKARAFGVDKRFSERSIPGMYDAPTLGVNYRMSDINAALGRQQLARIDEILERRRQNFKRLKTALGETDAFTILDSAHPASQNSHYCLSVVLRDEFIDRRNEIIMRLKEIGVGTSVYYPHPVPRMSYYQNKYGYEADDFKNAAAISDGSIALPVGPHLTIDDIDYIAETVIQTIRGYLS